MDSSPRGRLLLVSLAGGGAAIAILSILTTKYVSDPIELLLGYDLVGPAVRSLLAWAVVAWTARRVFAGPRQRDYDPVAVLIWVGFEISLVIAIVMIFVAWLAALALGDEAGGIQINAVVLPTLVCFFSKVVRHATADSAQVMRHWRERS